jgi:TolA-binding protein
MLGGCVIDRTGRSVTPEGLRRDMALQAMRSQALQAEIETVDSRILQLERVARARGQEVILQMESMDQMRQDVAAIRGDIEVVQHRAGMGTDQLSRLQEDADYRLAQLEQRARELEDLLGFIDGQRISKPEVAATPSAPSPDGDSVAFEIHVATDAELAVPTEQEFADSTDTQLLALIREHVARGLSKPARVVAEQFASRFPDAENQAEVAFLFASSWYGERSYEKAILAFQKVLEKYPDSEWAPWALLRQGQCFAALGQKQNASFFFDDISALYPKTVAAGSGKLLKDGKTLTPEQEGPGLQYLDSPAVDDGGEGEASGGSEEEASGQSEGPAPETGDDR